MIENNTSRDVKMYVSDFSRDFVTKDTLFLIGINKSLTFQTEIKGRDSRYIFPFGEKADSIILYNNTDTVIFTCSNGSESNMLKIENYSGGLNSDGYYKYVFKITDNIFLK